MSPFLLAIDPGRQKVGVVLLRTEPEIEVVRRTVCNFLSLESEMMSFLGEDRLRLVAVAMGNGTHVLPVQERLRSVIGEGVGITEVDETNSTLEARELFYQEFPPGFLLRLLPPGLWPEPDIPLDGYAAEVLGRRYLAQQGRDGSSRVPEEVGSVTDPSGADPGSAAAPEAPPGASPELGPVPVSAETPESCSEGGAEDDAKADAEDEPGSEAAPESPGETGSAPETNAAPAPEPTRREGRGRRGKKRRRGVRA